MKTLSVPSSPHSVSRWRFSSAVTTRLSSTNFLCWLVEDFRPLFLSLATLRCRKDYMYPNLLLGWVSMIFVPVQSDIVFLNFKLYRCFSFYLSFKDFDLSQLNWSPCGSSPDLSTAWSRWIRRLSWVVEDWPITRLRHLFLLVSYLCDRLQCRLPISAANLCTLGGPQRSHDHTSCPYL